MIDLHLPELTDVSKAWGRTLPVSARVVGSVLTSLLRRYLKSRRSDAKHTAPELTSRLVACLQTGEKMGLHDGLVLISYVWYALSGNAEIVPTTASTDNPDNNGPERQAPVIERRRTPAGAGPVAGTAPDPG